MTLTTMYSTPRNWSFRGVALFGVSEMLRPAWSARPIALEQLKLQCERGMWKAVATGM
jgi:hypothetical protein